MEGNSSRYVPDREKRPFLRESLVPDDTPFQRGQTPPGYIESSFIALKVTWKDSMV